jgi:3-hydroxyisobutyrate dehydrogenase-like beta-hydroxyacid dehydrogenase
VAKDLGLIGQLAERVGAVMPQAAANRAVVLAALDVGMGSRDMAAMAHWLAAGSPSES